MPIESIDFQLPDGVEIKGELLFLYNADSAGPIYYLQAIRSVGKKHTDSMLESYDNLKSLTAMKLAQLLQIEFDCILSPPSRYEFASFYKTQFLENGNSKVDISDRITKISSVTSGENEVSIHELYESLSYSQQGDEADWASVLIVDDIYATGKTVGSILARLREAGLHSNAIITVAAPLRIAGKCQ